MNLSLKLPTAIGRYILEGEVASGGMATVYYGHKSETPGYPRRIAIKRMHPHCAHDPEFVAMFLDEANLAARIRHPNVVPVLDIVSEGESLIMVMEYIAGETVSRLLRHAKKLGKRPPQRVVAAIVVGVLEGLHAAHEIVGDDGLPLNIVHRDVSPQNIIVGLDGIPRVLDFGVAKAAVRLQTTRTGQLKGRLQYMAPEQIRNRPVDRRADVYSVSVVFWEMLAGRRLFEADNEGTMIMMVIEGTVPSLRGVDPTVSADLERLILKGLCPSPSDRFETAREMAVAIEQTVGLASAEEVAQWVREVVPLSTAQHVARIAGLDLDTLGKPPKPKEGVSGTSSPKPEAPTRKGSRKLLVAAFGATFVLCIVGFWFALHQFPGLGPTLIRVSRTVLGNEITAWIERVAHSADAGWSELWNIDQRPEAYWNLPSASVSPSASPPPLRFRPPDLQPMNSAPFARKDGSWMPTHAPVENQSPHAYRTILHANVDNPNSIVRFLAIDRRRSSFLFVPDPSAKIDETKILASLRVPNNKHGRGIEGKALVAALPNRCAIASFRDGSLGIDHWSNLEPRKDAMSWWTQVPSCLVLSSSDAPGLDDVSNHGLAVGLSADGNVLYLVSGERVSRVTMARALRYVGVRHAAQVVEGRREAALYVHSEEGRLLLASDAGTELDEDTSGSQGFFYMVKADDEPVEAGEAGEAVEAVEAVEASD